MQLIQITRITQITRGLWSNPRDRYIQPNKKQLPVRVMKFLISKRNCQRWNALRGEWGAGEVVGDRGGGGVAVSALWSISTIVLVGRTGNYLL